MPTQAKPHWYLRGTVIVACNCDYGCPCNFNARPSRGECEGGWTWHLTDGAHDGVRLGGLNFSMLADWPGAIHEGNGTALILIDERADDRQRETIQRFLDGQIGGPWTILVNSFNQIHGPRFVPYEVTINEERSHIRAGEALELSTEPVRNPVTGVEVHPRAVLPEGFIFKDGALLRSAIFTVRDGIAYDHSGQYAAVAPFAYEG